jgi:hypothetical protein
VRPLILRNYHEVILQGYFVQRLVFPHAVGLSVRKISEIYPVQMDIYLGSVTEIKRYIMPKVAGYAVSLMYLFPAYVILRFIYTMYSYGSCSLGKKCQCQISELHPSQQDTSTGNPTTG